MLSRGDRQMPYWWDEEIEDIRKECHSLRRKWIRKKKVQTATNVSVKERNLKKRILVAKKEHWKNLLSELENDIWGDGFRIALRRLPTLPQPYNSPGGRKAEIIRALFPVKRDNFVRHTILIENVIPCSLEELLAVVKKMKMGTNYRITVEATKIISEVAPSVVLNVLN